MAKSPAFQFYAADFYMDTVGWTCEEIGVYVRLLMAEWVNGDLPDDEFRLAKICQISYKKFHHNFKNVSPKFVKKGEGFLQNLRLEKTREEQAQYIEKQREKGKIRASKMWEGHIATAISRLQPEAQPKHSSSSSSSFSIKEKKYIKKEKIEIELPKDIDPEIWKSFIEMRMSIKAPLTENAKKLILNKLIQIGQDKNAVLNQSIENSYRGIFPLREQSKLIPEALKPQRKYEPAFLKDKFGNLTDLRGNIIKTVAQQEQEIREQIKEGLQEEAQERAN